MDIVGAFALMGLIIGIAFVLENTCGVGGMTTSSQDENDKKDEGWTTMHRGEVKEKKKRNI